MADDVMLPLGEPEDAPPPSPVLTDEPLDEPPRILAQQRAARGLLPAQFDVMKIGETRRLQKTRPP